jgi:hypothetical protein
MKEIKKEFHELLKAVKLRKKVFLLLDGLDQLDGTNHGQEMDWLPFPLPSDTFTVVLSTLSDEESEIMPALKVVPVFSIDLYVFSLNTHPKYGTDLSEYVNMMSYACALQYM